MVRKAAFNVVPEPTDGSSARSLPSARIQDSTRTLGAPLANGKHEHFAHLVARGESPAKAYVLSGYSKNGALQSGCRLLRQGAVSARVQELKTRISERQVEKIAVDRAWVMAKLVENVQRAMQFEPVRDGEGNPSGQFAYQGGVANKALELLGKELGMFQPKPDNSPEPLNLIERLNAGRARVANWHASHPKDPEKDPDSTA